MNTFLRFSFRSIPRHQSMASSMRGFSLIELMISMVIGIMVVGTTFFVYANGMQANRFASVQTTMSEDGQMALSSISQVMRQAGFVSGLSGTNIDPTTLGGTSGFSLFICDSGFTSATLTTTTMSALKCNSEVPSPTQTAIAVSFEADASSLETSAAGNPLDCSRVSYSAARIVSEARFYLDNGKLKCIGNATNADGTGVAFTGGDTLAENIDEIHIALGVASVPDGTISVGYLTNTAALGNADGTVGPTNSTISSLTKQFEVTKADATTTTLSLSASRWRMVRTVRICVVVKAERSVSMASLFSSADADKPAYVGCDGSIVAINDDLLRRAFSTVVVLRNHYPASVY